MRTGVSIAVAAVCIGMTAACSKSSGRAPEAPAAASAGPPAAATPPATPAPPTTVTQADLPRPMPGLWEVTTSTNGRPPHVERNCTKGEKDVKPPQLDRALCPKMNITRTLTGGYDIDAECGAHGITSMAHVAISGDFHTQYASDSRVTLNFGGRSVTTTSHTESHYVGPCSPAGGG
jgi:hypothetical protein